MAKQDFLSNLGSARNLFVHPRQGGNGSSLDPQATAQRLARAAIWLAPKSVAGFNAADFPELGLDRQRALQGAVREFLAGANPGPPGQAATGGQSRPSAVSF